LGRPTIFRSKTRPGLCRRRNRREVQTGSGTYTGIADGIGYAVAAGAQVINMSLSGPSYSSVLHEAVMNAHEAGVTIVCASGNDGSTSVIPYPAAFEQCIAVGATDYAGNVAHYSNQGAELDVTAPGGDLRVDLNGDGYHNRDS